MLEVVKPRRSFPEAFKRKAVAAIDGGIDERQTDLDVWLADYNASRPHQGRWCYGKTPLQTFLDAAPLAREKVLRH